MRRLVADAAGADGYRALSTGSPAGRPRGRRSAWRATA